MIGIYKISNLQNGKVYIGQSVNISARWSSHKWALKNGKHDNSHLQYAWNKYGPSNFEFSVLEECDKSQLNERETFWKNYYDPNTYNIGHTNVSGTMSEEARMKLRAYFTGDNNPAKRPESRKKIAEARRGKTVSEESRKQISQKLTGRKLTFSAQHIQALRQASPNKKKIVQLSSDNQVIKVWESISDAARALGSDSANLCTTLSGKQKTFKGYKWKYYEEYEENNKTIY